MADREGRRPGLFKAIAELWPEADHQRCTVHRLRNVLAKPPRSERGLHEQVRGRYWSPLDEASDPDDGERRLRALVSELARAYPSAAACLADDAGRSSCTCASRAASARLRSSNLLERSLEQVQRRVKIIGRFTGETSCLSLAWAVLDLVLAGARGLGLSEDDRQSLSDSPMHAEQSPVAESA